MSYKVFGLGNPLLDLQTRDSSLLAKYDLKDNDAILAEPQHEAIYDEVMAKSDVEYTAGGAAQNAMRGAQYVLPADSTIYVGCVGKDAFADQLRARNEEAGLRTEYLVDENTPTGTCAVILKDQHRSMCTRLGAANNYSEKHLQSENIWRLVQSAEYYYIGGFHLTVCVPAIKALGEHATENNKVCIMNLSAPFLCQFFKDQMDSVLPYVDILIGNESEALAYAESHSIDTNDIAEIAKKLAVSSKVNANRPRCVIITQGSDSTIVARAESTSSDRATVDVKQVEKMPADQIVDTNGAGDAFAGGFLGALASGKSLDDSIEVGHWLASLSIKLMGPNFPYPRQQYSA
ncbi:adenosine kinase [Savitreella phatthalungensis]